MFDSHLFRPSLLGHNLKTTITLMWGKCGEYICHGMSIAVYTRVLTQIQHGLAFSVNPDCNPDLLNRHPLVDYNSVRDRN